MTDNYEKIVIDNLRRLYADLPADLADRLPAEKQGSRFIFPAFGQTCTLSPDGIDMDGQKCPSVLGILISLYAINACDAPMIAEPFCAFKEMPGSMPYSGAFATHTEQILVARVEDMDKARAGIRDQLCGRDAPPEVSGDFAFVVQPLPKIALCYIVYKADEDFPASVTCLFSANAHRFLPTDALADTGEYTSKKILEITDK
ncbi:MAG: DUF3786 domain-containing protein [Desulfobacterales bacterium]|nr:DUF3786 domain-containing protein [Desulfobacterales bacterium]